MTGAAGLADRQVDGVADHVDILQTVDLQRFVIGRQPSFIIGGLRDAALAHHLDGLDWRSRHQDVEGLRIALGRVGDFCIGVHTAQGEATLKVNVFPGKDARQNFTRGRCKNRQLRNSWATVG